MDLFVTTKRSVEDLKKKNNTVLQVRGKIYQYHFINDNFHKNNVYSWKNILIYTNIA